MIVHSSDTRDTTTTLDLAKNKIVELPFSESTKNEILKSFNLRLNTFSNEILFFNEPFTPVSITGTDCELNCKHCQYPRHQPTLILPIFVIRNPSLELKLGLVFAVAILMFREHICCYL